jgi:hypothetical protein
MRELLSACRSLSGKPEWKRLFRDEGVDGEIILRSIIFKQSVRVCRRLIWLRIATSGGLL